jgi:hypothetical protein
MDEYFIPEKNITIKMIIAMRVSALNFAFSVINESGMR